MEAINYKNQARLDRTCADCEKPITKAHRVYLEAPYCTTCYYREFKHRKCSGCGDLVRLPRFDTNALCRPCEQKKPCVRCNKTGYKIGKFTKYGPACNGCSMYFRKIEHCEVCGLESQQLSRSKKLPHDLRACPRCIRSTHATCERCKRHRPLQETKQGEKICKTCFTKGYIPCPECAQLMPAGRGNNCEECYWSNLLNKRTQFITAALSSSAIRRHFQVFSDWLLDRRGSNVAAIKIDKYFPLFLQLDQQWKDIPNYLTLLKYFGPEALRRYRLSITWMIDADLIELDENLKQHYSELGQITRHMKKVSAETVCGKTIHAYLNSLYRKREERNTSLRSLRLSLSAAIDMSINFHDDYDKSLDQKAITRYLIEKNGQKANITPFINFLNKYNDSKLLSTVDESKVTEYRKKTLGAAIVIMQSDPKRDAKYIKKWVTTNLQFYHDVTRITSLSMFKVFEESVSDDGYRIFWKENDYWIPKPILIIQTSEQSATNES